MKTGFSFVVMAVWFLCAGPAPAQNYAIDWFTIDGGGGASTGGVFSVNGTVGQPDAGTMSGGAYSVAGGFWGILAVPAAGAPLLTATNANGTVVVSWPRPADGFLLERTAALASPPTAIVWNTVSAASYQTNTTRIFITVPMPMAAGKQFYRLHKP